MNKLLTTTARRAFWPWVEVSSVKESDRYEAARASFYSGKPYEPTPTFDAWVLG